MASPVQIWEIQPDGRYVAAIQFGPAFTGPVGLLQFVDGIARYVLGHPREYLTGREVRTAGLLIHIWEYRDDHEIRWTGETWEYVPRQPEMATEGISWIASIPMPPVTDALESKPMRKVRRRRRVRCAICDELVERQDIIDGRCPGCRD